MNKYGRSAVEAAKQCQALPGQDPVAAWQTATTRHFGAGTAAQSKGCPKGAFLGLCEAGFVRGIPSGAYTRSILNKRYAVDAVVALQSSPHLAKDASQLWEQVMQGECKQHNSQMDVVIALWRNGCLTIR